MIPPHSFKKRHETLIGEMAHLAVETAKIRGVNRSKFAESLAVGEYLERTFTLFIGHVLRGRDCTVGG